MKSETVVGVVAVVDPIVIYRPGGGRDAIALVDARACCWHERVGDGRLCEVPQKSMDMSTCWGVCCAVSAYPLLVICQWFRPRGLTNRIDRWQRQI